jgi:hypothetical protein
MTLVWINVQEHLVLCNVIYICTALQHHYYVVILTKVLHLPSYKMNLCIRQPHFSFQENTYTECV